MQERRCFTTLTTLDHVQEREVLKAPLQEVTGTRHGLVLHQAPSHVHALEGVDEELVPGKPYKRFVEPAADVEQFLAVEAPQSSLTQRGLCARVLAIGIGLLNKDMEGRGLKSVLCEKKGASASLPSTHNFYH